jgi:SAM-dependent methyltransferase
MGYVFEFNDALACEEWLEKPKNRCKAEQAFQIMTEMLRPIPGQSVVDIGCGVGYTLHFLKTEGLQITGVDASPYMIDMAANRLGDGADLHRSKAEDLPFDDNSFDYALLFNTLEFVDDINSTLEEACRVAKNKLFVGFINRFGYEGVRQRVKGIFGDTIYRKARFLSIGEIKRKLTIFLGDIPMECRNLSPPFSGKGAVTRRLNQNVVFRHFPLVQHAGLTATLVPRFRARPMKLPIYSDRKTRIVPG